LIEVEQYSESNSKL